MMQRKQMLLSLWFALLSVGLAGTAIYTTIVEPRDGTSWMMLVVALALAGTGGFCAVYAFGKARRPARPDPQSRPEAS